ncbi:hypothetical protein AAY473_033453 [Plecturocebus cupreus]
MSHRTWPENKCLLSGFSKLIGTDGNESCSNVPESHFAMSMSYQFHSCCLGWSANGMTFTRCNLNLLGSSNSPASASQVAGIIETRFHHVGEVSLQLPTLIDPPALASQSAGITAGATSAHQHNELFFIFSKDHISLCCPGWSSNPPTLASQSVGITSVNHHAFPMYFKSSLIKCMDIVQWQECSGMTTAHCTLDLPGSSNPHTSASEVSHMDPTLLLRLEYSVMIMVPCRLDLPGLRVSLCCQVGLQLLTSSDPPTLASQSAGFTGMSHLAKVTRPRQAVALETRFYLVAQAGLELLDSSDLPTSAFQSAGITSMSHCTQQNNDNGEIWKITSINAENEWTPHFPTSFVPTTGRVPAEKPRSPARPLAGRGFAGTQRAPVRRCGTDRDGSLVPSPQGKQQSEVLRTESPQRASNPGRSGLWGTGVRQRKTRNRKTSSLGGERPKGPSSSSGLWLVVRARERVDAQLQTKFDAYGLGDSAGATRSPVRLFLAARRPVGVRDWLPLVGPLVPSPQGEQQLEVLRTEKTAEPGKAQLCGEGPQEN